MFSRIEIFGPDIQWEESALGGADIKKSFSKENILRLFLRG